MFNKESQYISIVKYNNQLKIDYKRANDGQTVYGKESTFIIYEDKLPKDIATKINTWQKAIVKTFITTLHLDQNEKFISKLDTKKQKNEFELASLNNKFSLRSSKQSLAKTKSFFELTNVDYVYSPFHILNLYLELNPSKNSLLFFTINNYAYILITDGKAQIIDSSVIELATFEEVQQTNFFESEVVGQKLFDEIYYLQLQEAISEAVKNFYSLQNDNFIEKINILYTQKQLNDTQIQSLQDELMMDINYHNISVKEALYELARKHDKKNPKSYIKPRKKRSKFLRNMILALMVLGILGAGAAIYFEHDIYKFISSLQETKMKKEVVQKQSTPKVLLPNHQSKNLRIKKELNDLLESVPVDALLKSVELKSNNSLLVLNLLKEDTFVTSIQPKLLQQYKYSNIQIKEPRKSILEATIYSNEKVKAEPKKMLQPTYNVSEFMPKERVLEKLKSLLPEQTLLRFKDSFKSEVSTFNYAAITVIDSPKEFSEMIKILNSEPYSINLTYPVSLTKVSDGIEVMFILQFHQNR